jgi:chromosome condensin MukBEF complex kleisin-like MukF subunit
MNKNRCKETIVNSHYWGGQQCSRKHIKDGYCKQHHPETVKARRDKQNAIYDERRKNSVEHKYEELIEKNIAQAKMIITLRDQLTIALEEIQKLKSKQP